MSQFDLLSAVQPAEGWFAVVGIKRGGNVFQQLVETREEVDEVVAEYLAQGRDVYFGVAKYATDANRTRANVKALRAFWLDVDCAPEKAEINPKTGRPAGYVDQTEGAHALEHFCRTVGLPKPILVNSGRGIHAYWALDRDITREEWEPVAASLRKLTVEHDFFIDPQVFEVARVLRVPGTLNFKDDPAQPVSVVGTAKPVSFEKFRSIVGTVEVAEPVQRSAPRREQSELGRVLASAMSSNFGKIIRRSASGDGCQQLWACYEERETLDEPRWFDALSIAKFCEDRDKSIHLMSEGHPDYDPAATEQKTRHIVGPHTCAVFERNNPGGCAGCPHLGKITSPISLGKVAREATRTTVEVVDPETEQPETYIIPTFPRPFYRGEAGGIWKHPPPGAEADPIFVYEHDLYVVKRMRDPNHGEVILLRLHLPRDGVREFIIPLAKIAEPSELKKALAYEGVVGGKKCFDLLTDFINAMVRDLQFKRKAEEMRLQFGWADNDSKFIIGDMEIGREGMFHSPPSTVTQAIAQHMGPTGSLEKWKEIWALYGRPELEAHAFAALTGFGAPLLKFLGQKGAIINVVHPSSGTGKTTILHMANSVWGAPDRLCAVKEDTLNAKIMRLGVYNNLPFCVDEMTNTTPQDFSTLIYNMSQGRGKDRVKASANELRLNLTSWQTISLCSSNASFYEKLMSLKGSPDGEMMRLIEYKIDYTSAIDPAVAKQAFDHDLMENYGHAGPVYAKWLVMNLEEARTTVLGIQAKLDRELRLAPRERFWSAVVAANITGGLIAKELGLIDWNMKRIYEWAAKMIIDLRKDVEAPASDCVQVISDYINRNLQNILVVNEGTDARKGLEMPIQEPRGTLAIRYEPDTKRVFLASKPFRADCVENQINFKETLRGLETKGIFIGGVVKRMSKGMMIVSPPTYCLELDGANPEFNTLAQILPTAPETADAGGGS